MGKFKQLKWELENADIENFDSTNFENQGVVKYLQNSESVPKIYTPQQEDKMMAEIFLEDSRIRANQSRKDYIEGVIVAFSTGLILGPWLYLMLTTIGKFYGFK